MYDLMSPEDRREFDAANIRQVQDFNSPQKRRAMFANLDKEVSEINRAYPMRFDGNSTQRLNFWGKDETDDFAKVEDADEEYLDDEMTSMAHAEVELHREVREYARIAAWDMPFLSSMSFLCPVTGTAGGDNAMLTDSFHRLGQALLPPH